MGLSLPAAAQKSQPSASVTVRPSNPLNLPSSPILPMTNPIAPMTTAPVQPFVRYQGPQGTPTVVVPPARAHVGDRRRGRNDGDGIVFVPVYVPYDFFGNTYYEPPPAVAPTVPGVLPGMDPSRLPPATQPSPVAQSIPAAAPAATTDYPESRDVVITPQAAPLVVERPALGTSRTEVLTRYGEPFGRLAMSGKETLYFQGGLTVVFQNERVVEVR